MCTYLTHSADVRGSGYARGEWIDVRTAVVSFDHPQEAPLEHALCIDFRADNGDPSARVAVELDAGSARRLAETILRALDSDEVRELLPVTASGHKLAEVMQVSSSSLARHT
jgi:hypothetical protein